MNNPIDSAVKVLLDQHLGKLEQVLSADVLAFYGGMYGEFLPEFLEIVEQLVDDSVNNFGEGHNRPLFIVLTTSGGSPIAVERFVDIVRHHYTEVNFIVPDFAYSAGTIFCMSGDNIFMDYFSVLGPIDPQVRTKDGRWVSALGYLDKINELVEKSRSGNLTIAEWSIVKEFDLAELRSYEQARELTIDQLKKWLVRYKFKNWTRHNSNGQVVTDNEKEKRAEEIAEILNDTNRWKAHARPLNIETLEKDVKLKIVDYSSDATKKPAIREYHKLIMDFMSKNGIVSFIHTRRFP